jgi:hypothetical protein
LGEDSIEKKLIKRGFIKSEFKKYYVKKDKDYEFDESKIKKDENGEPLEKVKEFDKSHADIEQIETYGGQYVSTEYPKPSKRAYIQVENFAATIEEPYFWILNFLKKDMGFIDIEKIVDIYSATQSSSFFSNMAQRISIQQDKIGAFMGYIGRFITEFFGQVHELRMVDEKLSMFEASRNGDKPAEIALKGRYVDFVDGGAQSPSSVFGLANKVGFGSLPDLFFGTANITDPADIEKKLEEYEKAFSNTLLATLKRKLAAFVRWKIGNENELQLRKNFLLHQIKQQYDTIRMYGRWLIPYFKNVKRMSMNTRMNDNPEMVSMFEGSNLELELLFKKPKKNGFTPCVLVTMEYYTRPGMDYQGKEYHNRGPSHIGKYEITFRSYAWNDDQLNSFLKYKSDEEIDILKYVDSSMSESIEYLKSTLDKYFDIINSDDGSKHLKIKENYGKKEDKKADKKSDSKKEDSSDKFGVLDPFVALFGAFGDIFLAFFPFFKSKGKKKDKKKDDKKDSPDDAKKSADKAAWLAYNVYKKSHGHAAY